MSFAEFSRRGVIVPELGRMRGKIRADQLPDAYALEGHNHDGDYSDIDHTHPASEIDADEWTTYTPTFSGAIGNGSLSGAYVRIGRTIHFRAGIAWGSTTSHGASVQTLSLPVTAVSQEMHGTVNVNQGGTGRWMHLVAITTSTVSGKLQDDSGITDALPVAAWANGHYWTAAGTYEAVS